MWSQLTDKSQLKDIMLESQSQPVAIFKHSTSCSISGMSKMRLESGWDLNTIKIYYLDLLKYRDISNAIAADFKVHHESPQIILMSKGECIYDASHFDISIDELKETLEFHQLTV